MKPIRVLLVDDEGRAELVGVGGRPLLTGRRVRREAARPDEGARRGHDEFRETTWSGERVLARAVVNLVENALQAMDAGGHLTISVAHDPRTDEVELSVADTGHGLGPEVRSRLFEPYFSTKSSGTGLGLAISRRAVEVHGGSIEVSSESSRTSQRPT